MADTDAPVGNGVAGLAPVVIESPADGREAARTAALVRRLVNDPDWVMPHGSDVTLPKIMYGIAQRDKTTVATALGPVEVDNQRAQIEATKTLVAMRGQNMADRHHREGKKVHSTSDVFMLVADARGNTRPANPDDIRAAAGLEAPASARPPVEGVQQQSAEPGRQGG